MPGSNRKYRGAQSRLNNFDRQELNEYGIPIPSKDWLNYTPDVNDEKPIILLEPGRGVNYNRKAKTNRNNAWKAYQAERARRAANQATRKNVSVNANKPLATERKLFGGKRRTAKRRS